MHQKNGRQHIGVDRVKPSLWPQSDHDPAGGPPALVIRMSGSGSASSSRCRPASLVTSAWTVRTSTPYRARISFAVRFSVSPVRPFSVSLAPASASFSATPRPKPFELPQTIARLPLMPDIDLVPPYIHEAIRTIFARCRFGNWHRVTLCEIWY